MFRYLLCSFAFVLLYPTAIDLYLVGLPQIAQDLGASESQLHIAFSVYLAGMAATMLFAGTLADRIGRKPVAMVGAAIFAMASWLGGQVDSSTPFLLARFAQGIGAGACYVVAFAVLRDTLDDQRRAKVLSMLNGITCIIPVIAPVVGHLIMLYFPWPTLFTTMAAMGVLVCLLATGVLKETNPNRRHRTDRVLEKQTETDTQETFTTPYFISRMLISSLAVTVILTFVNVSPTVLMNGMGFSRGEYASTMALTALVSMITSFATPFAMAWVAQRTLQLLSQGLFVLAAILLASASLYDLHNMVTLVGLGMICAGFSVGFGVTMSQALSPYARRAGMASSLLGIAQVCSSACFIWLMGLCDVTGLAMLIGILLTTGIINAALLLCVATPPRLSQQAPQKPQQQSPQAAEPHEEISCSS
ncbi:MFS transporter [Photobacterium aphoticum]|uniref:MFS transporter n=1 Tax=Photobacterium aphoticum TaxID=754436 RepID=UPI0009E2DDB2|nr:MFS transporter [Photobacterium aphoticum]PSU56833.1 multidrug transporter MdtL [Photobacterium aphoticum]GHA40840.1 multidrug resistance protein MdtL [Photobacterium aphoticum]